MSSLMLQDTTNLLNAVGNLAGGFAQLHQTRVAVETQRRAVEIQSRQQNFLKQQYLEFGNPDKLEMDGMEGRWRDRVNAFDQEIQDYLGEIKDDKVRAGVQANLQNNANQFQLKLLENYATLERQETQTFAVQTYQELLENGNDTQAIEFFQNHIAMGIWSPSQAKDLEIKIFRPWLDNQNANAARNLAEFNAKTEERNNSGIRGQAIQLLDNKEVNIMTKDALTGKERPMTYAERNRAKGLLRQEQDSLNDKFLKEVMKEDFVSYSHFVAANDAAGTWNQLDGYAEAMFMNEYNKQINKEVGASVTGLHAHYEETHGRGISFAGASALKREFTRNFIDIHNQLHARTNGNLDPSHPKYIDPSNPANLHAAMWAGKVDKTSLADYKAVVGDIDSWKRSSGDEAEDNLSKMKGLWDSELVDMMYNYIDPDTGYLNISYHQALNLLNQMRTRYAGDPMQPGYDANSPEHDQRIHTWVLGAMKVVESKINPDEDIKVTDAIFFNAMSTFEGTLGEKFRTLFGKDPNNFQDNLMKSKDGLSPLIYDILQKSAIALKSAGQDHMAQREAVLKEIEKAQKIWESSVGVTSVRDGLWTDAVNSKQFQDLYRLGENPDIDIASYTYLNNTVKQMGSILFGSPESLVNKAVSQGAMKIPLGDGKTYTITKDDIDKGRMTLVPVGKGNDYIVVFKKDDNDGVPPYIFGVNVDNSGIYLQRSKEPLNTTTYDAAITRPAQDLQNSGFWATGEGTVIRASDIAKQGLIPALMSHETGEYSTPEARRDAAATPAPIVITKSNIQTSFNANVPAQVRAAGNSAANYFNRVTDQLRDHKSKMNLADVNLALTELESIKKMITSNATLDADLTGRKWDLGKVNSLIAEFEALWRDFNPSAPQPGQSNNRAPARGNVGSRIGQ